MNNAKAKDGFLSSETVNEVYRKHTQEELEFINMWSFMVNSTQLKNYFFPTLHPPLSIKFFNSVNESNVCP